MPTPTYMAFPTFARFVKLPCAFLAPHLPPLPFSILPRTACLLLSPPTSITTLLPGRLLPLPCLLSPLCLFYYPTAKTATWTGKRLFARGMDNFTCLTKLHFYAHLLLHGSHCVVCFVIPSSHLPVYLLYGMDGLCLLWRRT